MKNSDWKTVYVPTHPLEGERWVAITEYIRNNATGEVRHRNSHTPLSNDDDCVNPWWWSDGNAHCDCNRRLFFFYEEEWPEQGEDEDDDTYDARCNPCTEGQFSINLENPVTGKIFYEEFNDN